MLPDSWGVEGREKTLYRTPNSPLPHLKDTGAVTDSRTFKKSKQNTKHAAKVTWPVRKVND